jgi:hypothetical protein
VSLLVLPANVELRPVLDQAVAFTAKLEEVAVSAVLAPAWTSSTQPLAEYTAVSP